MTIIPATLRRRPLALFLALAFLISWGLWLAAWPLYGIWFYGAALVATLGLFGPLFSALIVAGVTNRDAVDVPWSEIWKTLGPVFLVMALAGVLGFAHLELLNADVFVAAMVVGAAVYFLFRAFRRPHDFNLGAGEAPGKKRHWIWPAAALFLPPVIMGACILVQAAAGGEPVDFHRLREGFWRFPLVFSAVLLYMGPLGEEPGWRGFALPLLLKRRSPLVASILIGAIWAVWHLPVDLAGHDMSMLFQALCDRSAITLPVSVVMTWLYVRGGRSLLLPLFLHASLNTTFIFFPLSTGFEIAFCAAALVCVFASRMWKRGGANRVAVKIVTPFR